MKYNENGWLFFNETLSNEVFDLSERDIESLIQLSKNEEQWSHNLHEGSIVYDKTGCYFTNPLLDDVLLRNISGTVISYPFGDYITFNSSRHIYRGENQVYSATLPSLNRKMKGMTKKEKEIYRAVANLRIYQFSDFIWQVNIVPFWMAKFCDINWKALAQHYGLETHLLDLTNDIKAALFFATCYYDLTTGMYKPLTDELINRNENTKYGILFHTPNWQIDWNNVGGYMDWSLKMQGQKADIIEGCEIDSGYMDGCAYQIGFQPLMRCHYQSSYVFPMRIDDPLQNNIRFEKMRFRQSEKLSNQIYQMLDCGRKVYPDEGITSVSDIVSRIQKSTRFSEDDVNELYEVDVDKKTFRTETDFRAALCSLKVAGQSIEIVSERIEYPISIEKLDEINRHYNNIDIINLIGGVIHIKQPQKEHRKQIEIDIYGREI